MVSVLGLTQSSGPLHYYGEQNASLKAECSCVSYTEQHSSIVDEHIKAAILPLDLLPGSLDALLTVYIQEEELWAQPLPL